MIILKSKHEIEAIRKACQVVAECHRTIAPLIKPGITTNEIDRIFEDIILKHGAKPYEKGYKGYPYATCASVNDVIAHGFPSDKPLEEGDIVTIDTVAELDGWLGDSAWSYAVGKISPTAEKLMRVTKECLDLGIAQAQPGNRLGDVTSAIQRHAESHGFGVVRDLLAHGIGRDLHEEPTYVHIGNPGKGPRIKEGMVFTIEPMITEGTYYMTIDPDGWTARTLDRKLAAQYEHTIAITAEGPQILTAQ
ncbi:MULTISPECIES: type I methionyl aminopeptidase [Bacillales]|uniref:Methionine aminopeptidase n=4 Tax=Paenibacillus TaxID=44249 RepID=A0A090ZCI2_PAEMA|nr:MULTISPECIES: type I methionyl aminopeptidase [Paenibacillaceae]MDU5141281.1 type I methionyl aminopeptidase [Paenibacillus dendritiformis]SHE14538.1 methionine aminopeptidase [Chlamydia abortus]KFN08362.1 methionine aminopeptidase, type I [Paenibacillus macerans]MBS5910681.1 type I methionyl aminopeptidase [Paenibacillus macerans]MCY7557665.1 type I methionyl aminopeptidase [Paenibacillus macerans]